MLAIFPSYFQLPDQFTPIYSLIKEHYPISDKMGRCKTSNEDRKMLKYNLFAAMLLLLLACNPSDFGASYNSTTTSPSSTSTIYQKYSCEQNFTTAPPMVDFLFLWDNSTSQYFVTSETKAALNNLVNTISTSFNYRILIAPLLPYPDAPLFLVTYDTEGLNSYAQSLIISKENAADKLSQFINYHGKELGLSTTLNLLATHFSNGIFRQNAYTNVVIMSNGDDQTKTTSETVKIAYATQEANSLLDFATQTLHSTKMRFLSITAHSSCGTGFTQNIVYRKVSELVNSSSDAFDICNQSFTNIFNDINSSIKDTVTAHTYNYWPIRDSDTEPIDIDSITITDNKGNTIPRCSSSSCTNGFYYTDSVRTVNTRISPSAGEPFTGYSVQLFGDDFLVTYPDCLNVQYDTKTYYYGYAVLPYKPLDGSIQVTINSASIPNDSSNGWTYLGYASNLNMRVVSPSDPTKDTPADSKSGYFVQLHGDAVYHSGDTISVTCLPTTQ